MEFDVVFYGATPGGIAGAYEARRQGLTAIIVGGWRERHLGGMMSGGLGGTDLHGLDSVTGLGRTVLARIAEQEGRDAGSVKFQPRFAEQVFEDMVREAAIPVVWSDGVVGVERTGDRLTALRLADGRVVRGRYFADCGYEGDLMALAGVTYAVGREPADQQNPLNGYRGLSTDARGRNHNWSFAAGRVDPFVVRGDPSSGLLPGVVYETRQRVGSGDDRVQAYCFRMIMTTDPDRRVDLPSDTPAGFSPGDYELLFRWLASLTRSGARYGVDYSLRSHFLLTKFLGSRVWDVNNRGAFSLDLIGGSHAYPDATYRERETIWKRHEQHIRGYFYALQHHADDRVPAELREDIRRFGLDRLHFRKPNSRDEPHWPYQLYVRESRRMVSDWVCRAADLAPCGEKSDRPVANGAYRRDSHHVQRLAVRRGARWRLWNEGNFEASIDGGRFSVPWDVVLPSRRDVANLMVGFCVSATHEAFGAIRMEPTLMGLGQAIGAASALALKSGGCAVQDIDYAQLRAILSGSSDTVPFTPVAPRLPAFAGETDPSPRQATVGPR